MAAQLQAVIKRKPGVRTITIQEDYLWLSVGNGEDDAMDPKVSAPILTHLEYRGRLAVRDGIDDPGSTIDEIYTDLNRLVGYRALTLHIRMMARRGWLIAHKDDGHGNGIRWSLNLPAIQAAIDNLEAEGDHSYHRTRYDAFMQSRLTPNSRRIPVTRAGRDSEDQEGLALAPMAGPPVGLVAAAEMAVEHCPLAEKHECPLIATVLGRDGKSRAALHAIPGRISNTTPDSPPNGPQVSRAGLHGTPNAVSSPSVSPAIIQWLIDEVGIKAPAAAAQLVHQFDETTLRNYWEWTPYYHGGKVDDPQGTFVAAVRGFWGRPAGHRKAMRAKAAFESSSAARQERQREIELNQQDRDESNRRVENYINNLGKTDRAKFEEEVETRLKGNALVYKSFKKGEPYSPLVLSTVNALRGAIALEWQSIDAPASRDTHSET